jgi:hypothetical protein
MKVANRTVVIPPQLDGDGRAAVPVTLERECVLYGTRPVPNLRYGHARHCIERFVETRRSTHSQFGGMLWIVLWFCQLNKLRYSMMADPNHGYVVELLP